MVCNKELNTEKLLVIRRVNHFFPSLSSFRAEVIVSNYRDVPQPLNKWGRWAFSQGLPCRREQGVQSGAEMYLTAWAKFSPRFVRHKQNTLLTLAALPIWSSQLTLNVLGEIRCPQLSACALMAQTRHHFQWMHIKNNHCGSTHSTMRQDSVLCGFFRQPGKSEVMSARLEVRVISLTFQGTMLPGHR